MMKKVFLTLIIFMGTLIYSQPEFSGHYQNWISVRTLEENDLMLLRNRFRFNTKIDEEMVRLFVSLDFKEDETSLGTEFEMSIREAYVDLFFDHSEFRIGKQQVVWGKADGVFINDIVCPQDMRQFLLQDMDEIRAGIPMVKGNFFLGSWTVEGVWIPKFEPWQFAQEGSDWVFSIMELPEIIEYSDENLTILIPVYKEDDQRPELTLNNSEWGIKMSGLIGRMDLSVLYLDSFSDVFFYESTFDFVQGQVIFTPKTQRTPMTGLNFSTPILGHVLRGEWGYFSDKVFHVQDSLFAPITSISDYFQGMVGVDISGPFGVGISVQGITQRILDYSETMIDDEITNMATLMVNGKFLRDTASTRLLTIYDLNDEAGLANLDLGYQWTDALNFSLGGYWLWGPSDSVFGQFDGNDNVYVKVKYSF